MTASPSDSNNSTDNKLLSVPRNTTTKRIFIAATRMNDGKTTTSLALFGALRHLTKDVGFIKPVGQRFVDIEGQQIDEDSVLLDKIFNVAVPMQAMSPIAIHPTFTREYLDNPSDLRETHIDQLCRAFDRAAYEKDYIIIEGTGHAGVGSVFGLSNADVAKRLNAKVIIVASGGIGGPMDQIALNKSLFEKSEVEVIGVIINKVLPEKIDMVEKYCRKALSHMDIPLLGCIPAEPKLTKPNLHQVAEEVDGQWVNGKEYGGSQRVDKVVIGAMAAKGIVDYFVPGVLIITPGDREEIILSAITAQGGDNKRLLSGIILTHNILPDSKLMTMIQKTKIPVISCSEDSYVVASRINKMTVKTQPEDSDKIPIIKDLVTKNVDIDLICEAFASEETIY